MSETTDTKDYIEIDKQEYINLLVQLENLTYKVQVLEEGIAKAQEIIGQK